MVNLMILFKKKVVYLHDFIRTLLSNVEFYRTHKYVGLLY